MRCVAFVVLLTCWIVTTKAVDERGLPLALGQLAATSENQGTVTAQALLEGPPELTTSLPLFNQLVREDRRELLSQIGALHLFGGGSVPHNATHAELFLQASALLGSAQAQFLLGTQRASTNDSASAYLYYEFAAHGSSISATMALGYRALHGYSSVKSCSTAMRLYKLAADRVVTEQSDQKLQLYAFPEPTRLSETEGVRYHLDLNPAEDFNRAEYLRQRAADFRNADLMVQSASITLFSNLYKTTNTIELDEHATREQQALLFLERSIEMGNIKAQTLLGHVYAYGLAGCLVNITRAMELYEAALNASHSRPSGEAANGLGVVYSQGVGDVPVDLDKARNLFMVAANAGHAKGVYNTGMAFLELGAYHTARAKEYFVAAAHVGHLKSLYQLARIKQRQIVDIGARASSVSCEEVVELYKRVAEFSREGSELMTQALTHTQRGNWALALELYLIAAEMGYEVAQSNAIWLIERIQRQVIGTSSRRNSTQLERLYTQLVTRAAGQDSVEALLRMGDGAFEDKAYALALRHYQHADLVSAGTCARALYSVGYMYEQGHGVSFASTERASLYYHLAGVKEPSLRLVMAALNLKLRIQSSLGQYINVVRQLWVHGGGAVAEDSSTSQEEGSIPTSRDVAEFDKHSSSYRRQMTLAESDQDANEDSSRPHEYAAALRFQGDQSQLLIEFARGELPLEQQDFTIETWLRIDDLPSDEVVTLVDALDNFQLELLRATGKESWMLRFRKFSLVDEQLPELVLRFPKAPLTPHTWYHVAITFDATYQTVMLLLNGKVKQVLSFRPHPAALTRSEEATIDGASSSSSKFLAIGSTIGRIYGMISPNSRVFSGQLVHFRLWKTRKTAKEISVLMLEQYNEVATRNLLVHLRYKLNGASISSANSKPTTNRVMNGDQIVPEAQGVQLKIVEFPPSN
ncbi:Concanavalin A-like lectin/glucanases superfamily [Phytophthora infestans]|uniref:Concanavalin A-like lectin/glucanases superfamily n=1 Tax=Phytophthora infestans TaxID=4787 RepID=A0A8S9UJ24_PHYIN|nr:Concanavalin A-like lectin/glucanases superfamily [Phytophthora infestans]